MWIWNLFKPLCTMKIEDVIRIDTLNNHKWIEEVDNMKIIFRIKITTRLDYDGNIEEKKLREGNFEIVLKGTYRGNKVVIKKMKSSKSDEKYWWIWERSINDG